MSDHRIHTTSVIFTPTLTSIGTSHLLTSDPTLKIQIFPSDDGKEIESIQIRFSNFTQRLSEDIIDAVVFQSLTYSMKGDGNTLLDRVTAYMRSIPQDDVSVIAKEYSKYIDDGFIIDGLVAGIGAYIAFLILNENSFFINQMPFQFSSPCTVHSGNAVNHNIFTYLSLPLMAMSKTATGILLQLVLFIQSFINIWDPLFIPGPIIGCSNEARMCVEVVTGYSTHITGAMAKSQSDYLAIENKLQEHIDSSLKQMRREINNLLIDAKDSIKELASHISGVDSNIKEKVETVIEKELESRLKNAIDNQINLSNETIKEIIADSNKIQDNKLTILDHKIDDLYAKVIEQIPVQVTPNATSIPQCNNFRVPISNRYLNTTPNRGQNPNIGSKTWNRRKVNYQ
jgi:hypothetical protein